MRQKIALATLAVALVAMPAAFADYYATKADERNGVLTPGNPPYAPEDGSDTCAAPTVIPGLIAAQVYNDSGTTIGKTNTVGTIPIACNGNYTTVAGPDAIYTFTTGTGDNPTFLVTTTDNDYDPSIYILATCNSGPSCLIGADNCFARSTGGNPCGAVSDEQFGPTLLPDSTTLFFYVDSFYAVGNNLGDGPFDLTVTGPLPVELIEFSVE